MRRVSTTTWVSAILVLLALILVAPNAVQGAGSKEKTPKQKAAEAEKKAVKEYNKGVKHMEKSREIGSKDDSTFAYNYRATVDSRTKKELVKAVKRFRKAVSHKSDFAEAYNNLGYCLRKTGQFEASLAAYDRAISLDKDFAQARQYRAETFLALGWTDRAGEELAYLRQINSPYADTLQMSFDLYRLSEMESKIESAE